LIHPERLEVGPAGAGADARGMVTRRRCTECGRRFKPAATAAKSQKVCGPGCRLARRRKQARRRRQCDLDGYRDDELARQHASRAERRAAAASGVAGCHAPASDAKCLKTRPEIDQIVAETFRRSRAGLERELRRMARKIRPIIEAEVARGGP
jgi:hypothetical protein